MRAAGAGGERAGGDAATSERRELRASTAGGRGVSVGPGGVTVAAAHDAGAPAVRATVQSGYVALAVPVRAGRAGAVSAADCATRSVIHLTARAGEDRRLRSPDWTRSTSIDSDSGRRRQRTTKRL